MAPSVLICLDDAAVSAVVQSRFEAMGWRRIAGPFLGAAVKQQPDLIVLDARADYLLKALKRDRRTAHLTVVVIAGYGDFERRERCLELGALAFLARPADFAAFDTLTGFIEHGRSGAA
jgi:CheY-like chemotaxis protein